VRTFIIKINTEIDPEDNQMANLFQFISESFLIKKISQVTVKKYVSSFINCGQTTTKRNSNLLYEFYKTPFCRMRFLEHEPRSDEGSKQASATKWLIKRI
jgi:hypothetical protein